MRTLLFYKILCYNVSMSKSILIAGKYLPEATNFADGAEIKMRSVAITDPKISKDTAPVSNIKMLPWTRPSPVAARTLILECERIFGKLDEVVLYFDESYFATKFHTLTMQNCSQTIDDALLGYQYLTLELLSRFEKNSEMNASLGKPQSVTRLVFLIKKSVNEFDIKKNPALRTDLPVPSNAFVAAAASAFVAFAENIAAIYNSKEYVEIILVSTDFENDAVKTDNALGQWLCDYLDELDTRKKRMSLKQELSWIKAGSKFSKFLIF